MRIGPAGLFDIYNADFYLVKPNLEPSSMLMKRYQLPFLNEDDYLDIAAGIGPWGSRSQTDRRPCDYEVDPFNVCWDQYDVVISINYAIPLGIRLKHPGVTWMCMPGEGLIPFDASGWDYWISHDCPKSPLLASKVVDMPYTFLSPHALECFIANDQLRAGVYIEINSLAPPLRGDWLAHLPVAQRLVDMGFRVNYHPDNTKDHLALLGNSLYFIKLGGRPIRGNSIYEAMSAGLVCLIKPCDCFGQLTLPRYCYYKTEEELIEKLYQLDCDSSLRNKVVQLQYELLENIMFSVGEQFAQAVSAKKNTYVNQGGATAVKAFFLYFKRVYKPLGFRISLKYFRDMQSGMNSRCPPIYEV